jgi:hypothetical protein
VGGEGEEYVVEVWGVQADARGVEAGEPVGRAEVRVALPPTMVKSRR